MGGLCRCRWRRDAGPRAGADEIRQFGRGGGADLPAKVIPFLLRAVNLLGIDSVLQPHDARVAAWARIADVLPMEKLNAMVVPASLEDLPRLGADILEGKVRGRVVVEI